MKKTLVIIASAGLLFVSACSPAGGPAATAPQILTAAADPAALGFSPERLARLDSLGAGYVREGKAPQAVMLVARHGQIVYDKAFGWKDRENGTPAGTDDIFRIASMSKAIVSVALMTLYEQGRFLLDDPLYAYLPEFREMTVLEHYDKATGRYTVRPAKRPITIRHLLCHSSGISYGNPAYDEIYIPRTSTLEDISLEETVRRLATRPLNHDPGEKHTYGMSVDVIGRLIEVLSGQPLDRFLRQAVLDPLGMDDTWFYLPDDRRDRLVTLYSKRGAQGRLEPSDNRTEQSFPVAGPQKCLLGGAGLCSTIHDYARFCQMLLNGGTFNGRRILAPKTVETMTRYNQLAYNDNPSLDYAWGLGFQIHTPADAARTLTSVGEYGWSGMYGTYFGIDPQQDLFFILFCNANPWHERDIIKRYFHVAVYQALTELQ